MSNLINAFDGYIANFDTEDGALSLTQLQSLVISKQPCLINFFTKDTEMVSSSLQEAEKDRGGLGKTVLLERSRNYVFAHKFPNKDALKDARYVMPTIELAEQYKNTRQSVRKQLQSKLESIGLQNSV